MATGRIPTTANSPLTVKGDLFGYSTTQARVPIGNDGETLVADSSASVGIRYQANFAAGKNKILNSDYSIWQRGTTFTNPGNTGAYTADRYAIAVNAATTSHTVSQQSFTPGAAPVAGYEAQYFYRSLITTPGSCTVLNIQNRIEDVRTFAGQTVTFSFFAKADTTRAVSVDYYQTFGSGGSGTVAATLLASTNLTTGWVRYSATVTLPSISGKTIGTGSYLGIVINQTVTAGSTLDIWGVQLEAANTATAFQTATGTIQGELGACQRYYYRAVVDEVGGRLGSGYNNSTIEMNLTIPFPVTMRTRPTALEQTGTAADYQTLTTGNTITNCNSVPSFVRGQVSQGVVALGVASGLVAGQGGAMRVATANAYLGWSAEL